VKKVARIGKERIIQEFLVKKTSDKVTKLQALWKMTG